MPEPGPGRKRIAVTGIGPVTPVGTGVEDFWSSMTAGKSGAGPITRFDATDFKSKVACEVKDFSIEDYLPAARARRMDRFTQLAYAAATLALADAGMKATDPDPTRVGIVIGSGIGGIGLWEEEHTQMLKRGPRFVSPSLIAMMIPNSASGSLAIEFGFTGPNECTVTACASSGHAIGRAMDYIRYGMADVVLVGGAESCISPMSVASFCAARALTTRNDEPERASRPFDAGRDGFVIGEAATCLVFESMEHAVGRGARILAEAIGYGLSSDAYHLVAAHPDGAGAAAAMTSALADAQIAPGEVGYVNAHATSTKIGDTSEAQAIRKVFGSAPPPSSATKSMTGHLLGAAGATEAAAAILALSRGVLPPTINYETPDPECDLDVVPNTAREAKVDVVMSNSFGFGGHNVSVIFGRP